MLDKEALQVAFGTLKDVLITSVMFNGTTQRDLVGINYQFQAKISTGSRLPAAEKAWNHSQDGILRRTGIAEVRRKTTD